MLGLRSIQESKQNNRSIRNGLWSYNEN